MGVRIGGTPFQCGFERFSAEVVGDPIVPGPLFKNG